MADQILIPTIEIKEEPVSINISGPTSAEWANVNLLPGPLKLEPTEWFPNINLTTSPKEEVTQFLQRIPATTMLNNGITGNVRTRRQHLLHNISPYDAETLTARKSPRTRNVAACMSKFQRIQPAPWPINSIPPRSTAPLSSVVNTEQRTVVSLIKSSSDAISTHTPTVQSNQSFMIPIQSNNGPIVVPFLSPMNTTPGTTLIPLQASPNELQNFQSIQQSNTSIVSQPPLGMLLTQACIQDGSQSLAGLLPPNTINSVQASAKQTTCNVLGQLSVHNQLNPSLIHSVAPTSICNVLSSPPCISSCGQTIINSNALYSSPGAPGTVNVSGSANILNQPTIVTFPTFSNILPVPSVSNIMSDPKGILNQTAAPDICSNVSMYNSMTPAVGSIQSLASSGTNKTLKAKPLLLPKPPAQSAQIQNVPAINVNNGLVRASPNFLQTQTKNPVLVTMKTTFPDKTNIEGDDPQNPLLSNSPNETIDFSEVPSESLSYSEICRKEQKSRLFRTTFRNYHLCKRLSLALLRASSTELVKVMREYRLLRDHKMPFTPILTSNKNMEHVKGLLQILAESTEKLGEKKLVVSRTSSVLTSIKKMAGYDLTFLEERIYFVFKGNPYLRNLATNICESSSRNPTELEFMEVAVEPDSIVSTMDEPGLEEWASIENPTVPCEKSSKNRTVQELLIKARQDKQEDERNNKSTSDTRECRTDEDQIEARNSSPLMAEASVSCPACKVLCADLWTLYRHIGVCHLSLLPGIETCRSCRSQVIPNNTEIHGCDVASTLVPRKVKTYRCYRCFKHLANNGQLLRHRLYCSALTIRDLKKRRKQL